MTSRLVVFVSAAPFLATLPCPVAAAQGANLLPATVVPAGAVYSDTFGVDDFNGDGFLDVAVPLYTWGVGPSGVGVAYGKGRGLFQLPELHSDSTPEFLAQGDATGDGLPDIIAAGRTVSAPSAVITLWVYPGQEGAPVAGPLVSTLGSSVGWLQAIAVGDLDDDGAVDVALSEHTFEVPPLPNDSLRLAFGAGDGTFGREAFVSFDGNLGGSVLLEDVNRDGHRDITVPVKQYLSPFGPNRIQTLLGDGSGAFGPPITSNLSASPQGLWKIGAHDLDQDGLPDIVAPIDAGAPFGSRIELLLNIDDGHFLGLPPFPSQHSYDDLGFMDLDGNGSTELILAGVADPPYGNPLVDIHHGLEDFQLDPPVSTEVGLVTSSLMFGDADGDGDDDLFLGGNGIAFNLGDGRLAPTTHVDASDTVRRVRSADFNGDGHLDLVGQTSGLGFGFAGEVFISLGAGTGVFDPPFDVGLTTGGTKVLLVAQLDPDAHPDLVYRKKALSTSGPGLHVALATGSGTSFEVVQDLGGGLVQDVVAADLNGDGVPDLAATSSSSGLYTWSGLGDGSFGRPVVYPTSHSLMDIAVADFDGNGSVDLAVASDSPPTVVLYLNSPGGGLMAQDLGVVPNNPQHIVAADLDGDGVLDLATGGQGIQTIELLVGYGGGAFAAPISIPIPYGCGDLFAKDMNGDAVLDLVALSAGATILLGKGGGRFHLPMSANTGNAERIEVADLDADGFPDVAAPDGEQIRLLMNRAGQ